MTTRAKDEDGTLCRYLQLYIASFRVSRLPSCIYYLSHMVYRVFFFLSILACRIIAYGEVYVESREYALSRAQSYKFSPYVTLSYSTY